MRGAALLRAHVAQLRALADALDAHLEAETAHADSATGDDLIGRPTGVPVRTWRAAIGRGELEAKKIGREYRARCRDVELWLERRRVVPTPPAVPRPRSVQRDAGDEMDALLRRVAGGAP